MLCSPVYPAPRVDSNLSTLGFICAPECPARYMPRCVIVVLAPAHVCCGSANAHKHSIAQVKTGFTNSGSTGVLVVCYSVYVSRFCTPNDRCRRAQPCAHVISRSANVVSFGMLAASGTVSVSGAAAAGGSVLKKPDESPLSLSKRYPPN